ncbi:MAG: chromate resistance protein ChrB domain-containing protein [Pseudobdellovibrionaceae bacterium]
MDKWLLLMHQIPPKQDSFRVKIWRLVQKSGAIQLKSSVYLLPFNDKNLKKFEPIVKEINLCQGDAFLCRAEFAKGIESKEIIEKFNQDRKEKYRSLADELYLLQKVLSPHELSEDDLMGVEHSIGKIERKLKELVEVDYFSCKEREPTLKLFKDVLDRVEIHRNGFNGKILRCDLASYQKRTWVTRSQVHVDRLASAWLIARFIDKTPTFKFIKDQRYKPAKNEVRFDMFDGEFSHIGDLCTFEVLMESFKLDKAPIRIISEIIHDLDLKDTKFSRPETPGIGMVINSLARSEDSDEKRIQKANSLFDDLYETLVTNSKKQLSKKSLKREKRT